MFRFDPGSCHITPVVLKGFNRLHHITFAPTDPSSDVVDFSVAIIFSQSSTLHQLPHGVESNLICRQGDSSMNIETRCRSGINENTVIASSNTDENNSEENRTNVET